MSPNALLWYGAIVLAVISFVNAAHIVSSWHVFYRNPVIREQMGKRLYLEHILLPLVYLPLFVLAAVKAYELFPASKYLLFLLVFDGPVFAHHVVSQDKGFLSLYAADSGTGGHGVTWIKRIYYPLMFMALAVIFSRSIILDQEAGSVVAASLPFEKILLICCGVGALITIYAIFRLRKTGARAEILYLANILVWCLINPMVYFRVGMPLMLLLIHSARHALLYVVLAGKYFERSEHGIFWLPMLLVSLPVAGVLFFVYLGLPGFWPGLNYAWSSASLQGAYPYLMGLVGALLLHHYHIERYSWKFSDKQLGAHLRSRILERK